MTPYGYKIVNGEAVIDCKEATNLRMMFRLYLGGFTIIDAAHDAGVEKSATAASMALSNTVYLGTDFYPRLITQEMFDQVQEEKQRRNRHPANCDSRKFTDVPIKTKFRMKCLPTVQECSASQLTERIYDSIEAYREEFAEEAFSSKMDESTAAGIELLFQTLHQQ